MPVSSLMQLNLRGTLLCELPYSPLKPQLKERDPNLW